MNKPHERTDEKVTSCGHDTERNEVTP